MSASGEPREGGGVTRCPGTGARCSRGSRVGEPAAVPGTHAGWRGPGTQEGRQDFTKGVSVEAGPPEIPKKCPYLLPSLRRQLPAKAKGGPVSAAGHRDALPGAWGGDRVSLGDSEAVAYRLLAGRLGTDGVNPLEAKTGRFVGSPSCRACSRVCVLWHRHVRSPCWTLR